MKEFLLSWFATPLLLWSFKTLLGFICFLVIALLPFAIILSIIDFIVQKKEEKEGK